MKEDSEAGREEYLKRESRRIALQRLNGFLDEYRRSRMGMIGIVILVSFAFLGIFGPMIDRNHPLNDMELADPIVPPEWVSVFGGDYAKLPPTLRLSFVQGTPGFAKADFNTTNQLTASRDQSGIHVSINRSHTEGGDAALNIIGTLDYPYSTPRTFKVNVTGTVGATGYTLSLMIYIQQPSGKKMLTYDSRPVMPEFSNLLGRTGSAAFSSMHLYWLQWFAVQMNVWPDPYIIPAVTLNQSGQYKIVFRLAFSGVDQIRLAKGDLNFTLRDVTIRISGLRFGLLGTDGFGRDVFAELVSGIGVSLTVGILSAFVSGLASNTLGIVAAMYGGIVDEFLMRLADIMSIMPGQALLLILMPLVGGDIWTAVVLIGLIFAPTGARGSRAFVLTYINSPYIESAKARGASRTRLIFRHIFPPMLPLMWAGIVGAAPAAVTMEAELSYLGIATDPFRMTWGKMLNQAGAGLARWAWWWVMPPGLCIMFLSLAFISIGHALDEIMNPRLKKRR